MEATSAPLHNMSLEEKDIEKDANPSVDNTKSIHEGTLINSSSLFQKLLNFGVELRGIDPVPLEERLDRTGSSLLSLWFAANCSLLPVATGMSGPLTYGLSIRDAALVNIFFTLLGAFPVAWMGLLGPQLGMRQMIQARCSFGMYLISIFIILQLATLTGYTIITAIASGQTIAAVSEGQLTLSIGIVISAIVGLAVSFMGYKILHLYEKWSWIPALIALIITVGCAGKDLFLQENTSAPTVKSILSYGSIVLSFVISWAPLVSDFAVYISPDVPRIRIFTYVYISLCTPSIFLLTLGSAISGAIPNIDSWSAGYESYSTGGAIFAILHPIGGFGKFVAVILAFSIIGNMSCSLYSLSINFQAILPILSRVPRYIWSIIITAIVIPVSISIVAHFLSSLNNFLGIIGYWGACFIGILLTEYHIFRDSNVRNFDVEIWNRGSKLPIGVAALGAGALSFGVIVPCMDTAWYTGPIARITGDIGPEMGLFFSAVIYIPLHAVEKRFMKR